MILQKTFALLGLFALSACGGSGGGGGGGFGSSPQDIFSSFSSLSATSASWSVAPDANVNSASGSANYDGIVNVGASSGGSLVGYLGQLDVTVDFSADTVSGSAGNFYSYGGTISPTAPNPLGPSVAGSLSFDGSLTGTNESAGVGGGIGGTFSGTVDGITETAGELSGMIMGDSREGIILYLSGENLIGVGIGAD